jgi:aminopeptidase N
MKLEEASLAHGDSTIVLSDVRQTSSDSLLIAVSRRVPRDTTVVLSLDFQGTAGPGIHTDVASDNVLNAAWTSGVPRTNRFWFPTFERLTDTFSSEVQITLPAPLQLVTAGTHVSTTTAGENAETYHFRLDDPVPSYLIGFAAGTFDDVRTTVEQPGGEPVILEYLVPPEDIGNARRTFRVTPDVMAFLTDRLGTSYPWPIYRQAAVPGIRPAQIHPPMTALVSDSLIIDQRAEIDFSPRYVIAYTLAHQWTGVRITPETWADSWIQQGLSAFLAAKFVEQNQGTAAGLLQLHQQEREYLAAHRTHGQPLVPSSWTEPVDLFVHGRAAKGARVFEMLRTHIGPEPFQEGLERLFSDRRFEPVSTTDLIETFEAVTDQSLDRFFDQWVFQSGHPKLRVSYAHNSSIDSLSVHIQQLHNRASSPETFAFDLPVIVHELMGTTDTSLAVRQRDQIITVPVGTEPRFVEVDPADTVLDSLEVKQPAAAWIRQLNEGATILSRLQAAREARNFADDPSLPIGLKGALSGSPLPEVHAAIVETMGYLPAGNTINSTIRDALDSEMPDVRAAALVALRQTGTPERTRKLAMDAAQNDNSYRVQATAVRTLAHLGGENAFKVLQSAFVTGSHNELIRRAAFDGLSILDVPLSRTLPLALDWSTPGTSASVRATAPSFFVGHLNNAMVRQRMTELLNDRDLLVRRAAVDALGAEGSDRAVRLLEQRVDDEQHPWVSAGLRSALGDRE